MIVSSEYDFIVVGITALDSLVLILVPYYLIKSHGGGSFSIQSLRLGRMGLAVIASYVILLYAITFPTVTRNLPN